MMISAHALMVSISVAPYVYLLSHCLRDVCPDLIHKLEVLERFVDDSAFMHGIPLETMNVVDDQLDSFLDVMKTYAEYWFEVQLVMSGHDNQAERSEGKV